MPAGDYSNSAIQLAFDRILRLTRSYGLAADWKLVQGHERQGDTPRLPWRITDKGLTLFILGYTRRSARESLDLIGTVFDYLISTEDWEGDNGNP